MRFRGFKKLISVTLAVMMLISAIICGEVITQAATYEVGETITYQFKVNCNTYIQAFQGVVYFPTNKLTVVPQSVPGISNITVDALVYNQTTGSAVSGIEDNVVYFNASSNYDIYDFSTDNVMVTVKFRVNDAEFNPNEIRTVLSNIYDREYNQNGENIPYSYKNVINGRVISSGNVDIDQGVSEESTAETDATEDTTESTKATVESTEATTESTSPTVESTEATTESTSPTVEPSEPTTEPVKTTYTVVFRYKTEDGYQTLTKTVNTAEKDVNSIVNDAMPKIENKMYEYSPGTYIEDGKTITANLNEKKREYTVMVDDTPMATKYGYKEKVTVDKADGTKYTFYVTGDMTIDSDDPKEKANLSRDALTVSDAGVSMDLLATANVDDFARMGVAFATSEKSVAEISNAVSNVATDTAVFEGIAVHNSTVDAPNESGSYQFVYAPYVSKEKADRTLYFYTFVVDTDGKVYVSPEEKVDLKNAYA